MGKSDPYLEFSRQMPDGKFVAVHRTEVSSLLFIFMLLHTIRAVSEAFCFKACLCICLWSYTKSCLTHFNTISYKRRVRILANLQLWCGWRQETTWLEFEVKRSQRGRIWPNRNFGWHFFTYLQNAWACFNESYHSYYEYSPSGLRDRWHSQGHGFKGQGQRQHFP